MLIPPSAFYYSYLRQKKILPITRDDFGIRWRNADGKKPARLLDDGVRRQSDRQVPEGIYPLEADSEALPEWIPERDSIISREIKILSPGVRSAKTGLLPSKLDFVSRDGK